MSPRFTIRLVLTDDYGGKPITLAVGVDEALRISPRVVSDLKAPFSTGMSFNSAVEIMHVRELRRKILIEAATKLGIDLAQHLADAEGWHDESRIEPTRRLIGGDWRD